MALTNIYPTDSSTFVLWGSSTNISESGEQFDFSTFNTSVQGGQPLSCQYWRTDSTYNYCQLSYYYVSGRYWKNISGSNGFGNSFVDNLNNTFHLDLPYSSASSYSLLARYNASDNSFDSLVWGYIPNDNASGSVSANSHNITIYSEDSGSGGESSGESSSDYAQITNAIILIPATIILVFFFKMIFNIFMNRKVRG